jgi:hypothetical protein
MPPELRPFAKPMVERVMKPGDDPILDAAKAGIRILDDDPNADPFYYDVKKRQAEAKKGAGIGNVSAYVAPSSVPAASEAKAGEAASPKVVVEAVEDPLATQAVDVRMFRARSAAARPAPGGADEPIVDRSQEPAGEANEKPPEAAPSPWSKAAAPPDSVRSSALPSSLAPRDVPTSASEKQAATPGQDRTKTKVVITVALVLVALGVGVAALTTRRTPENGSQGPVPTATTTAPPTAPAVLPPAPKVSAEAPAPAPPSATSSVAPVVAPTGTPGPSMLRVAPKPSSTAIDPYDAAAPPIPAVTAPPQSTTNPAPAPPQKPAAPPITSAPPIAGGPVY